MTTPATDQTALDGDCTIGATFKPDTATTGCLVFYGHDIDEGSGIVDTPIAIGFLSTKKIQVRWDIGGGNEELFTFDYVCTLGKWYRIHIVRDCAANTAKLYVNAELQQTVASLTDPSIDDNELFWVIGAWRENGSYASFFDGSIADVMVDTTALSADAILEDFRRAMLWQEESAIHTKLEIKDHDGDFQDTSSIFGVNFFNGGKVSDSSDNSCQMATFRLKRECYSGSLAKYHSNRVNIPGDWDTIGPTGTYNTDGHEDLLEINREVKFYFARMPLDIRPVSTDWNLCFHGFIKSIDWASDEITIQCVDQGLRLLNAYVERATVFPTNSDDVHTLFQVLYDGGSGHGILDKADSENWIDIACPTCYDLTTGGLAMLHWTQERTPLLPLLQGIAEEAGQVFRYRWRDLSDDFVPTLWEPNRLQSIPDCTLTANDYFEITQLSVDLADIRNAIQVLFASSAPGADPAAPALAAAQFGGWGGASGGQPGQYFVLVLGTDADLGLPTYDMARYSRQWAELSEGTSTHITTYAMAERYAMSVCRDLMNPTALLAASLFLFPELGCEDMLCFLHDDVHSTVDFNLATFSCDQDFQRDRGRTSVTLRGKPSGGCKRHLVKECRTSGALPGVRDQADIFAGRTGRWRLGGAEAMVNRTDITRSSSQQLIKNPDFNDMTFGTGHIFDGWTANTGTWGTEINVDSSNGKLGIRALKLTYAASYPVVHSNLFPVSDEQALQINTITKHDAAGQTSKIDVLFYSDYGTTAVGSAVTGISAADKNAAWSNQRATVAVPSGAKFARLKVYGAGTSTHYVLYDMISCLASHGVAVVTLSGDQTIDKAADPVQLAFDTETADYGGNYNTTTYIFTARYTGYYHVDIYAELHYAGSDSCGARILVYVNNTPAHFGPIRGNGAGLGGLEGTNPVNVTFDQIIELNTGDTLKAYIVYTTDPTNNFHAESSSSHLNIYEVPPP